MFEKVVINMKEIDKIIAAIGFILGVILSIYLIISKIFLLVPVTISVSIFSILYLFLEKEFYYNKINMPKKNLFLSLYIIGFLILLSFISVIYMSEIYTRPISYFIFVSLALSIMVFIIIYYPIYKNYELIYLIIIMIIASYLRLIPQAIYPEIVGIDPWVHKKFTEHIVNSFQMTKDFGYSQFPAMHILIAIFSILTNFNYKLSVIGSILIPQSISLIMIYYTAKIFFDNKIALISTILIAYSPNHILLGFWVTPTTFSLIIFSYIMYISFKKDGNYNNNILKLILSIIIILAHMQVAFASSIFLFSLPIGYLVYNRMKGDDEIKLKNKIYFSFYFFLSMLVYWFYATKSFSIFVQLMKNALFYDVSQISSVSFFSLELGFYRYILDVSPYLLFYGFSILGFLFSISNKSNADFFTLTMSGYIILIIPFLLLVTKISGLLAERWIYFSQLCLCICSAIGIVMIFNRKKLNYPIKFFSVLALSVIIFLHVVNPVLNSDNPIRPKETAVRYAHTKSELKAIMTLSYFYNKSFYTDLINSYPFNNSKEVLEIEEALINKNFSELRGLCIIREEVHDSRTHLMDKLSYNSVEMLSGGEKFNVVYSSTSVTALISNHNCSMSVD